MRFQSIYTPEGVYKLFLLVLGMALLLAVAYLILYTNAYIPF
ncbi:hypothetical protein ACFQJC_06655 [Haloferax namakaokahaiae]|uniref:Uncharacterized protein n=1 Tax=Haloferax namakaokahaiae TaxID=1748331 RepID=A0ABD5ZDD6_9EURY